MHAPTQSTATAQRRAPQYHQAEFRAPNFPRSYFSRPLFFFFFISPSLNRSLSKLTHRNVSTETFLPLALGESPRTHSLPHGKEDAETRRHKSTAADFRALAASSVMTMPSLPLHSPRPEADMLPPFPTAAARSLTG